MSTPLQRGGAVRLDLLTDVGDLAYTAARVLIADGDSYQEQEISGDATLQSDGTLRVTQLTDGSENVVLSSSDILLDADDFLVILGRGAGGSLTSGTDNFLLGVDAGANLTSGKFNVYVGSRAGELVTTTSHNVGIGQQALKDGGTRSIGLGRLAGRDVTGSDNVVIGALAGLGSVTSGDFNIVIGSQLDLPTTGGSGEITIGNLIFGTGADSTGTTIDSASRCGIGVNDPSCRLEVDGAVRVGQYTVAAVPSASDVGAGAIIYVSNGAAGSPILAFSDGSDWLRCDTGAAISST